MTYERFRSRVYLSCIFIIFTYLKVYCSKNSDSYACDEEQCDTRFEITLDEKWREIHSKIKAAVDESKHCQLNEDGCSVCHFRQIESDLSTWKGGITKELLDAADKRATTYQIIDHKVYREKKCVFEARCIGVEYFLTRLAKDLPDMEIKINVFDYPCTPRWRSPKPPVFSFSRDSTYEDIMYPAWTFWAGGPAVWPLFPNGQGDWVGTRAWLADVAKKYPWSKKQPKGFFIGSRTSGERDPLILLSRAKPELVDAAYTKNQAYKGPKDTLDAEPVDPKNYDEHCPFKYLFNFRGVAASFRLKHLFLCDSLVYHVGDEWLEFFYPALKAWVHYIPVKQDLSDAELLLNFAKENDAVAEQIANRGAKFIRDHLRQEDVFCYWKRLLLDYSKLLEFKPNLNPEFELKTVNDGKF
ncbi:protein O-glucosyltransferase 1-like isoform X1 [Watersipora subatra]|uniref:protein O-glucosyltransferase 1-like isoform X1 n=1 Tax=Watersipora subatra TaxID=2589382 RepID=UPI00355BC791